MDFVTDWFGCMPKQPSFKNKCEGFCSLVFDVLENNFIYISKRLVCVEI